MNELITAAKTMSSREIAELTSKRHDHVVRDIKKMLEELEIDAPQFWGTYKTEQGNIYDCAYLPKRESLILVSGYNIKMRAAIIDRWQELETGEAQRISQDTAEPVPNLKTESYLAASKIMQATKEALNSTPDIFENSGTISTTSLSPNINTCTFDI